MSVAARLAGVHIGLTAPLGPEAVASAFVKTPINGPVSVGLLGLDGDEQADLRVHGGPEKAVYGYAANHYPHWAKAFPELAPRFTSGSMGENLTIEGLAEIDLCVGDVHRIGDAALQVCQPRQPCFKLALAFEEPRLARYMVRNGLSGWYYRVLRGGTIRAGDTIELADRPHPLFAFSRLVSIVNFNDATATELRALASMSGLATRIRQKAQYALAQ